VGVFQRGAGLGKARLEYTMSETSLDLQAVQDLLDQPERLLATLDTVKQLEQARDQLRAERIRAAQALDLSPWQDKHNRWVRQANADAPSRLRGRLHSNFLTSELCAEYIKRAALALARLAGWEWAWRQRVAQHQSALYEQNKHVINPAYTEVSACATLREASKEAWERLQQTTGWTSPLMNPWTVEDVQRILWTDRRRLLHTCRRCSPLFLAAGQSRPEVIRGTKIEIETIRRSRESAAPAPASTAQQEAAAATSQPQRPESPTAAYCLLPGCRVRWEGAPCSIQPLLWALLAYLLSPEAVEVEEETLVDEVWGHDSDIMSKTVVNTVSRLNLALVPINFPWTWRTKASKVIRD
jgi:hypothetical protein